MNYFEFSFMTILDVIQFYLVMNKLCYNKELFRLRYILLFWGSIFIIARVSMFGEGQFSFFITSCLLISWIWFVYKKLETAFFLYLISTTIVVMVQLTILIPVYFIFGEIEYTFETALVAESLAIIALFIFVKFVPINIIYTYIESKNKVFKIMCINILLVVSITIMYWNFDFEGIIKNFVLVLTIAIMLMIITMMFLKNGLKNIGAEEQVRIYEQYLPIVDELVDELRMKQHDFDNHLLAIKMLIEMNKNCLDTIAKVEAYIDEIDEEFKNSNLIKLNNKVVAGFLYSKKKWALNNNVRLHINIEYFDLSTNLKDYELIEILSILIDNASETGVNDNCIIININKEKDKCAIEVLNKHPYLIIEQINELFKKGFSTKNKQGRGLGLYKLHQSICKNHGELQVFNVDLEENFLAFKVILPAIVS